MANGGCFHFSHFSYAEYISPRKGGEARVPPSVSLTQCFEYKFK